MKDGFSVKSDLDGDSSHSNEKTDFIYEIDYTRTDFFEPKFSLPITTVYDDSQTDDKNIPAGLNACSGYKHRSNSDISKCLEAANKYCPKISSKFNIGSTKNPAGVEQNIEGIMFSETSRWGLSFSGENDLSHRKKTSIALLGNMHGNEATGRELLLWLIRHLCQYHSDDKKSTHPTIQKLLKNSNIYIIPTINPVGFEKRFRVSHRDNEYSLYEKPSYSDSNNNNNYWTYGRYIGKNENVDMNRNFPKLNSLLYSSTQNSKYEKELFESMIFNRTYWDHDDQKHLQEDKYISNGSKSYNSIEPETEAVIEFFNKVQLDYSVNLHDGSQVVSYAFDYGASNTNNYAATPDDILYRVVRNSVF